MPTLLERVRPAIAVGGAFWAALADDDDDALDPLLSATWDGRPPGFARLYREDRSLAAETCRVMGLTSQAELLAVDRIRLFYAIANRPIRLPAEGITAWRLELVEVDGNWLVDRSSDAPRLQWIDLTPLFAADDVRRADESASERQN